MKCTIISHKACWQDEHGVWFSTGGFPLQMKAIRSLFAEVRILIVQAQPGQGGIPLPEDAEIIPLQSPRGAGIHRMGSTIGRLPYYLREISQAIHQSDVVHVPVPGDIPFIGLVLGLLSGKPVIARYGSSWETTSRTTLMNRVTKWILRRFAGGHNVMLATGMGSVPPSPHMQWLFATAIASDELGRVHPDLNRIPQRPLQIAYAGRFSVEKGVIYLLQALAELIETRQVRPGDLQLTLIGDGPLRAQYQQLIEEKRLHEIVSFAGVLDRDQLTKTLVSMDVVVLPSLTESFCKARLDAMLCGVPVITTHVGFGREIVGRDGERGWIVPPADPQALAERIYSLLTDIQDWPALRRRSRVYAEGFTLEKWVAEIGNLCARRWNASLHEGKIAV